MIWKMIHLSAAARRSATDIPPSCLHPEKLRGPRHSSAVAVVGGGPKGYYAVQRLVDELSTAGQLACTTIHWYNTDPWFGCGGNFRPDQPEFLLVNNSVGTIDAEAIAGKSNPLVHWINRYRLSEHPPAAYGDFASRALVGHYLADTVMQFINGLPIGTDIQLVEGQVTDILRKGSKRYVQLADRQAGGELPFSYRDIMLATGHHYRQRHPQWAQFTQETPHATYIPQVYPLLRLDEVPAASTVAMQGLGLTFIDAVLALTEGRGGLFEGTGDALHYHPSGQEPSVIYPFSRTNLPMLARSPAAAIRRYPLRFITPHWANQLHVHYGRNIDFKSQILPVLEREMAHAYHRTLWGDYDTDDAAFDLRIADTDTNKRFSIDQFLFSTFPIGALRNESPHQRITRYLKFGLEEAQKAAYTSPLMAAAAVWRDAVPIIRPYYANGGFSGITQQLFMHRYYGALNRVAFGPPVANMQKMACLAHAGYIRFYFTGPPAVHTDRTKQVFVLSNGGERVEAPVLIDARIARPDLDAGNSALFANLLASGLAIPMQNDGFRPGCVALTADGQLLAADGSHTAISAYGTPTEGVTLDNDSLSPWCNDLATPWAAAVVSARSHTNTIKHIPV